MREEYRERIAEKIRREFAPIAAYLDDPAVVEVMLNADGSIWIDSLKEGMKITDTKIARDRALLLMGSIARLNSKSITEKEPLLKATMPDGQRFQGMIEPVVSAPVFAIRCNRARNISLEDYVPLRMSGQMADLLRSALVEKKNIIVSGGTGSGKTTLTAALLKELAVLCPEDRIAIMEDTREINIDAKNVVFELANDDVSMCDLLAANLRMRPDRIILGETRGAEALDLLKSWNTGHPGGVCTLHANSAMSALARFETLILEAQNLSISYIRSLISDAVNLIVHIQRDRKLGGPIVQEIIEVNGIDLEGNYKTKVLMSHTQNKGGVAA